jgi:predicted RNA-binding Zn-ribbon protein involved in translation (DUF1610 family)
MPDSLGFNSKQPGDTSTADKSRRIIKPQKMIAGFLNPTCEHDWIRLKNCDQTLASEGKIIWQCRACSDITNTYNWQKP